MRKNVLVICFLLIQVYKINAQKVVTIEEVIDKVMVNSLQSRIIDNDFAKFKIEFSLFRVSLLPRVTSSITFPYQRSIVEVVQADGSQKFLERNYLNSSVSISVSQVLAFTGGSLSLNSSINNFRDFNNHTTNFSSNWANISYQQAINGYNSYRWAKKINPMKYEYESMNFLKKKLGIKYEISKLYSGTQLIQLNIDLLNANIEKTSNVLVELEEKFKVGRALWVDIEQVKIVLEQLKEQLTINSLEYASGIAALKNRMNENDDDLLILSPLEEENFQLDKKEMKEAVKRNGFDLNKTILLTESESNLDRIKKEGAISINFQLGMGLNSSATNLANLYNVPSQSQFVTFGAKIPIIDWGKARKSNAIAKMERDNIEYQMILDENNIDEQIDELYNYHLELVSQVKSFKRQIKSTDAVNEIFNDLMKYGRKTVTEYKTQIVETFNIKVGYQKAKNDLYLLKLKINEMYLINNFTINQDKL